MALLMSGPTNPSCSNPLPRVRAAPTESWSVRLDPDRAIDAEDQVLVADVVDEAVGRDQAAVLVAQAAEAGQPQADHRRQAAAAEVLDDPEFGIGKSFRPRRDAEGAATQRRVAVSYRGIASTQRASHGELRAVELRQCGRVAEDGRGHVLRHGQAHPRHAPGRRRQHVLGVRPIPLAQRRGACRCQGEPHGQDDENEPAVHRAPPAVKTGSKRHPARRRGRQPIVRIPVPTVASALSEMGLDASFPLVGVFPFFRPLKPAKPAILDRVRGSGFASGGKKVTRHHLCEAPSGPFRQMVPVTFFPFAAPGAGPQFRVGPICLTTGGCVKYFAFGRKATSEGYVPGLSVSRMTATVSSNGQNQRTSKHGDNAHETRETNPIVRSGAGGNDGGGAGHGSTAGRRAGLGPAPPPPSTAGNSPPPTRNSAA